MISNIEIRKYKCFDNFKVEELKRVNLIGGKNNIGKTAFLEACYIYTNSFDVIRRAKDYKASKLSAEINNNREYLNFKILELFLSIEQNRKQNYFYLDWIREEFDFSDFSDFEISVKGQCTLTLQDKSLMIDQHLKNNSFWNYGSFNITDFRHNKYFNKIFKKNNLPMIENKTFISFCSTTDQIVDLIDNLKLNNKYEILNKLLNEIFDIEKIDIIKNRIMLQENGKFKLLNDFGDGLRHFLYIVTVLLSHKNITIFIDEIENGIHYSLFDDFWKLILQLSKERNIQIFATTHSKECIESYNKVSQILNDTETVYFEIGKNKNTQKIFMRILDNEQLEYELTHQGRYRGE